MSPGRLHSTVATPPQNGTVINFTNNTNGIEGPRRATRDPGQFFREVFLVPIKYGCATRTLSAVQPQRAGMTDHACSVKELLDKTAGIE